MNEPIYTPSLFDGEGEVSAILRQCDWSSFPYGPPPAWPGIMQTTIAMVLRSRTPISFWWGPELRYFYNDAYAVLIGEKHPSALTRPFWDSWQEIKEPLMPIVQGALDGEFQSIENMGLMIERQGRPQTAYYTFSLLPVRDDQGKVIGILNPAVETTERIIANRAREFQLELADRIRPIADPNDIISAACEVLGRHLGVALVGYLEVDETGQHGFLRRDWTNGALPSMAGQTLHLDAFGPDLADEVREGRILAIDDVATDRRSASYTEIYAASGTKSYVAIPLVKGSKLLSIVCLHEPRPRHWTEHDIALAQEMVDRTWAAVESARAQAQQRETAERLQFVLKAAQIGEWHLDLSTRRAVRSLRHDQCFGYDELLPEWDVELALGHIHPADRARVKETFNKAIKELSDWHFECRVIWPDQSVHWISAHGSVYAVNGQPTHMTGIVFDITERKEADEKLRHAAMHDPLTGLPNRAMLFEYAEHLLPHNRRNNRCAAVLFIDLDRFKPINDTHGHEIGDQLLKEIANRLSRSLRAEDIVTRLGGDEFVVLLQDICEINHAGEATRHIVERLSKPFYINGLTLSLSASIGISTFPNDAQDIDTLISQADAAMYQAKQAGRNNYQFYSPEIDASMRPRIAIEQQLKTALHTSAFHLCYQPVVDLTNGEIVSVEALLRMQYADIGPDYFIPIAESTGIINPIGQWVMQEASRQYKTWMAHGLPSIPIAVNVSVVEFRDKQFVERFKKLLEEAEIEPRALQLELTETAVMDDVDHAISVLTQLQAMGVQILLDDFGTGHSSLFYLANLPLNKIKIDKAFVASFENDVASRAVTDAMLALGRTLNLDVVAEGIESMAALNYFRTHGCNQAQGYLLSKPLGGDEFESWYFNHQTHPKLRGWDKFWDPR